MNNTIAPYCMTNDDAVMMMFVMNIIAVSYVFIMNGAGILERLKCMFYYESKATPFNDRTHITRICNVFLYMQTIFYSTVIAAGYIDEHVQLQHEGTLLKLFGALAVFFAAVLIFKRLSYDAVNAILFSHHEVTEWRNTYFFTIKLLGFALAPAATAILFIPSISFNFVRIYLLFVLIAYLYTILSALLKIIFAKKCNYLDIFLYLCALEFLPMGIVLKSVLQVSEFLTIKN